MKQIAIVLISSLAVLTSLSAQYDWPNPSPLRTVSQQLGDLSLTLEYERPLVRGRKIFGGLVPWNEVWRTGAGYCTKIGFNRPVKIAEQTVPAGKYSIFTIPTRGNWTVIFNRDTTLYGSGRYDAADDILRFIVPVDTSQRFYEGLSLDVDLQNNDMIIHFNWAKLHFSFSVNTDVDERAMNYIDEILPTLTENQHQEYAMAAFYLQMTNQRTSHAIRFARLAQQGEGQRWNIITEAELLASTGEVAEAISLLEKIIEERPDFLQENPEEAEQEIQYLRTKIAEIQRIYSVD